MIEDMEAQARAELAANRETRARVCVRSTHLGNEIELRARRLKNGHQVFGYSLCAVKLERVVLQQLLQTDSTCPHCRRTLAQWKAFQGVTTPTPKATRESFQFRHLVEEVAIELNGQIFVARPAVFQCLTPCPINLHGPEVISKSGWDVFANGKYLAGGLTTSAVTGLKEPTLPSIEAVRAWVNTQAIKGSN